MILSDDFKKYYYRTVAKQSDNFFTMKKQKAKHEEDFDGIRIMEISFMPKGSGVSLPPFGILVGRNASINLKQHEYGHYLQYRVMGFFRFYIEVGLPSLWSATFHPRIHYLQSFEVDANRRAREYFGVFSRL